MDLKKIVMNLRVNHNLKGRYPLVVFTLPNNGGVYRGKKNYYVLTYREKENDLYFHYLKGLFHKYDKTHDFSLRIDKFNYYTLEFMKIGGGKISLISYKNDYFPFGFFSKTRDSYEGENNLQYILEELKKKGIKYSDKTETEFKKGKTNEQQEDNDRKREKGINK